MGSYLKEGSQIRGAIRGGASCDANWRRAGDNGSGRPRNRRGGRAETYSSDARTTLASNSVWRETTPRNDNFQGTETNASSKQKEDDRTGSNITHNSVKNDVFQNETISSNRDTRSNFTGRAEFVNVKSYRSAVIRNKPASENAVTRHHNTQLLSSSSQKNKIPTVTSTGERHTAVGQRSLPTAKPIHHMPDTSPAELATSLSSLDISRPNVQGAQPKHRSLSKKQSEHSKGEITTTETIRESVSMNQLPSQQQQRKFHSNSSKISTGNAKHVSKRSIPSSRDGFEVDLSSLFSTLMRHATKSKSKGSGPKRKTPSLQIGMGYRMGTLTKQRDKKQAKAANAAKKRGHASSLISRAAFRNRQEKSALKERRRGVVRTAPRRKRLTRIRRAIIQASAKPPADEFEQPKKTENDLPPEKGPKEYKSLNCASSPKSTDRGLHKSSSSREEINTSSSPSENKLQDTSSITKWPTVQGVHSSRFREYCTHLLSHKVDAKLRILFKKLLYFQERTLGTTSERRRLVFGFNEVQKKLVVGKAKMIILAPDIRRNSTQGGLDDAVCQIKTSAASFDIPVVFALGKRNMGYALKRPVEVSVVALLYIDGADSEFRSVMAEIPGLAIALEERIKTIKEEGHSNHLPLYFDAPSTHEKDKDKIKGASADLTKSNCPSQQPRRRKKKAVKNKPTN